MLNAQVIEQMLDTTWKDWNMTLDDCNKALHERISRLVDENDRLVTRADFLAECLLLAAVIIGLMAWALLA